MSFSGLLGPKLVHVHMKKSAGVNFPFKVYHTSVTLELYAELCVTPHFLYAKQPFLSMFVYFFPSPPFFIYKYDLTCLYGTHDILARGRNRYPVNPVNVLRDYIVDNGLRCHDLFYRFDANKDQIVTRTEFRKGILVRNGRFLGKVVT